MLGWFAETTLVAAGMTACIVLASRSRRSTAEVRHALWLVVLAKFVIPPVVAWPRADLTRQPWATGITSSVPVAITPPDAKRPVPAFDLGGRTNRIVPIEPAVAGRDPSTSRELAGEPPLASHIDESGHPARISDPVDFASAPDAPVAHPTVAPPSPAALGFISKLRVFERIDWTRVAEAGWLIGSLIVLVRSAVRVIRVARTLRRAESASDDLLGEVATVAARLGVRPPLVVVVPRVATPLIWCLGRPRLVLPGGMDRLTLGAREVLIAHELAHLARRDHWVVRLELLASLVWWWNPVFRFARRHLRDEAEAAADARVVRTFPARRFAYAEALVAVCEQAARPAFPLPALGIGGPRAARTLEARLTMILRDPVGRPSRRARFLMLALLALAVPTWSLGQQTPPPDLAAPAQPAAPTPEASTPASGADAPAPGIPTATPPGRPAPADRPMAGTADSALGRSEGRPSGSRLQARIAAQAAEVARAEAIRDRAQLVFNNTMKLQERKVVSELEVELSRTNLRIAAAEVGREQARLAELDAQPDRPEPEVAPEPAGPGRAVLQARRDAQAAEVRRVEAERTLAGTAVMRINTLIKKGVGFVSPEAKSAAEAKYETSTATVEREQAHLAEADALLAEARSSRASRLDMSQTEASRPATLADWRDHAELLEFQVRAKRDVFSRERRHQESLVKELGKLNSMKTSSEVQRQVETSMAEADEAVEAAARDLGETDLRQTQARRRFQLEEARIRREADRALLYLDWARKMHAQGSVAEARLAEAQGRYEELMFELDPGYRPSPLPSDPRGPIVPVRGGEASRPVQPARADGVPRPADPN